MAKKIKTRFRSRDPKRQRLLKKLVDDAQRYFSAARISPTQGELLSEVASGLAEHAGVEYPTIDLEALAKELGWQYSPED